MATLSGQTIANTFDSILHVEDDTAGLVATATDSRVIQDGVGANSALALATDSVRITSTNKLYFNDAGDEEIHSASDGHLEVNSGTTLDITAPTVDINASTAVTVDGSAITISKDTDAEFVASILVNQSDAADTTGIISQRFDLEDTGGNAVDSGKILVGKEASFTATGSTQDSYMALHTSLNGTLAEKMRIDSAGNVGIGESTPLAALHVAGATSAAPGASVKGNLIVTYPSGDLGLTIGTYNSSPYASWIQSMDTRDSEATTYPLALNPIGGNVGIGVTDPASPLEVRASGSSWSNGVTFSDSDGGEEWVFLADSSDNTIKISSDSSNYPYLTAGANSWSASSDIRLKENITTLSGVLNKLNSFRGVTFNFKTNSNTEIGVIAQEVNDVFPEMVDTESEYWGVQYSRLGVIAIQGLKELKAENDELKKRIEALEAQ